MLSSRCVKNCCQPGGSKTFFGNAVDRSNPPRLTSMLKQMVYRCFRRLEVAPAREAAVEDHRVVVPGVPRPGCPVLGVRLRVGAGNSVLSVAAPAAAPVAQGQAPVRSVLLARYAGLTRKAPCCTLANMLPQASGVAKRRP